MDEYDFKDQRPVTMYNMDIPLGTVFTCLFKNGTKLETQLVGYEHDNFFLLKFPTISGIGNYLVKDTPMAVLFKAKGFNVTFASTLNTPIPRKFLSFCNYPAKFKLYEIRNTTRTDCLLPASVTVKDERYYGVVQDISQDGCKLVLEGVGGTNLRKLEQGERIQLEIWTQRDAMHVNATIMRSMKNISRVMLGLAFADVTKQDLAIIQSFISSLQYTGTNDFDERN